MDPVFKLKLCYTDGKAIVFRGEGNFERNLVASIVTTLVESAIAPILTSVVRRGVGFGRTENHVKADVHAALADLLPELTKTAVEAVLLDLKSESLKLI